MDRRKWICTHGYPEIWHEKLIWSQTKQKGGTIGKHDFDKFKKEARKLYEKHMRITN